MTWEQVVPGLLAGFFIAAWWRERRRHQKTSARLLAAQQDGHAAQRDAGHLLDTVSRALGKVWHHVRPETAEEAGAVGVLRETFRQLPIPGKPRLLDRDRAQAVLGPMLQRAERIRRVTDLGAPAAREAQRARCWTLREVMSALQMDLPAGSAPLKSEPPAHVLDALDALNAALKADPTAMHELLAHRVPCNEALARHPTILVRREQEGHSVSAFGLLNGCLGAIPAGPLQDAGWLTLEEKSRDGEPLRCVLTTRTLCAWCRSRSGDGTRSHGGVLLPICAECVEPAARGKPPLAVLPGDSANGSCHPDPDRGCTGRRPR